MKEANTALLLIVVLVSLLAVNVFPAIDHYEYVAETYLGGTFNKKSDGDGFNALLASFGNVSCLYMIHKCLMHVLNTG